MSFVVLQEVSRTYKMGNRIIYALKDVSLKLDAGQLVVVLGPSGSGKTTLLNVLGGIDHPTSGIIHVGNQEITKLNKKKLAAYRRNHCGFIFQFFNLLPVYNALENVSYAVELSTEHKKSKKEVIIKSTEYLGAVGLENEKQNYFPSQMSGGEQQRVAAARAFAKEPQLLLCDEPTGELSVKEGRQVLSVIQKMVHQAKNEMLVVLVTHNQKISQIGNLIIRLRSGEVDSITEQTPMDAETIEW